MQTYRGIFFDLDGTLLDTLTDLAASVNRILERHGFPRRTEEEIRRFLGNGSRALLQAAVGQPLPETVFAQYLAEYTADYDAHKEEHTRPYAGILPLLEALRQAGLVVGVVSNKFDGAVRGLCDTYFGGRLNGAVGEQEERGIRRKPAPDLLFALAEQLGVPPQACLYVGDSEVDLETARQAGMDCISVAWGFRTEEELRAAGAGCVVQTPKELGRELHRLCMEGRLETPPSRKRG